MNNQEKFNETLRKVTKHVNNNPYLISILYDLNLLPEQISTTREGFIMATIVEAYYQGFEDCRLGKTDG
jgi:hypothetical protein